MHGLFFFSLQLWVWSGVHGSVHTHGILKQESFVFLTLWRFTPTISQKTKVFGRSTTSHKKRWNACNYLKTALEGYFAWTHIFCSKVLFLLRDNADQSGSFIVVYQFPLVHVIKLLIHNNLLMTLFPAFVLRLLVWDHEESLEPGILLNQFMKFWTMWKSGWLILVFIACLEVKGKLTKYYELIY